VSLVAVLLARRAIGTTALLVLTVAHPLLHPFEGGALDPVIASLHVWAIASSAD
jgi:hypothetical protein